MRVLEFRTVSIHALISISGKIYLDVLTTHLVVYMQLDMNDKARFKLKLSIDVVCVFNVSIIAATRVNRSNEVHSVSANDNLEVGEKVK